ncbi:JAG1 [Mytilus coruscus]|uniref:JAG1 n=1 Tax=Mytilus coruscus TaxID=42192 RepID=A0A6J8F107_MYTCO|nr:JAG1 [Mytilus coruscus]
MKEEECGTNLHCARSVCQCASSDYWTGSTCFIRKDEKALCNSPLECKATLQCRNNHCGCCEQDFWNGQFCERRKFINDACMKEKECGTNLHCARSVCQCASSDYWTGSTCFITKDENALCNSSIECKATLQCRNNHCGCCEQDFWNGQFCEKSKGYSRPNKMSDICAVEQCMNDGKCKISENRHRCECADGYLGDKCQYADLISNGVRRETNRNHDLTVPQQIMVTLRFLATGSFLQVVGNTTGLHEGTVSRIVSGVLDALCDKRDEFIKWPMNIRMTPSKACKIIIACAILHNICILLNEPDIEDDGVVIGNDGDLGERFIGDQDGRAVRDHISSTFFNR